MVDQWSGVFFGLDQQQRFVLLLVVIGCITALVISLAGIFAGIATSLHRRNTEAELKREMLEAGMSAEEISEVIRATPPKDFIDRWADRHDKRQRE